MQPTCYRNNPFTPWAFDVGIGCGFWYGPGFSARLTSNADLFFNFFDYDSATAMDAFSGSADNRSAALGTFLPSILCAEHDEPAYRAEYRATDHAVRFAPLGASAEYSHQCAHYNPKHDRDGFGGVGIIHICPDYAQNRSLVTTTKTR